MTATTCRPFGLTATVVMESSWEPTWKSSLQVWMLIKRITPSWLTTPRVCRDDNTKRAYTFKVGKGHQVKSEHTHRTNKQGTEEVCTWLAPLSKLSGRNSICRTVRTCVGIWITLISCLLSRHHRWSRFERPPAARLFPSLSTQVRHINV